MRRRVMLGLTGCTAVLVPAMAGCGAASASRASPARDESSVHSEVSCAADRVVLASQTDVDRLASCTSLHSLTVRTGAALDLSKLRALTAITGDLTIGPTVGVDEIVLGELRSVDGVIRVVGNGLARGLFLPRLERAGRLDVDGNAVLTTIAAPRLAAVGALRVTDNASLEALDLPLLGAIDQDLVLAGDPSLSLLEAPQLQHVSAVQIDAPNLPSEVSEHLRAMAAR